MKRSRISGLKRGHLVHEKFPEYVESCQLLPRKMAKNLMIFDEVFPVNTRFFQRLQIRGDGRDTTQSTNYGLPRFRVSGANTRALLDDTEKKYFFLIIVRIL